ncbi:hypothetical protein P170DRAFT_435592 [Aspergillus steynii IBT 23096]|uniref:Uncharacterized protein n=1 Tax=Aspergillus steynii IBT 23096 TaxID=1392250 RepID=A0A2I2GBZ0_9EURO|nr:uncharacterized protein P170DRAFT_435592 [Aspergillus steynii IBT 23096]PLB50404.1 hypothetical protein P170DRAFT_435592 [Aspergillus steynii IBT 23096]
MNPSAGDPFRPTGTSHRLSLPTSGDSSAIPRRFFAATVSLATPIPVRHPSNRPSLSTNMDISSAPSLANILQSGP